LSGRKNDLQNSDIVTCEFSVRAIIINIAFPGNNANCMEAESSTLYNWKYL